MVENKQNTARGKGVKVKGHPVDTAVFQCRNIFMWNNYFNLVVIEWMNQHASTSANFNRSINFIQGAYIFKGFAAMALLWFFWFRDADSRSQTRRIIIGTFIGCIITLIVATAINYVVPFQPRPLVNPALDFKMPVGVSIDKSTTTGHEWLNSFPSHHASMFFSFAMGIFLISRKAGYFAFIYAIFFIVMPRIYLGLHYPMDIVAGAILGMAITGMVNQKNIRTLYDEQFIRLLHRHPAAFQTVLLLLSFEIGVIFSDVLTLAGGIIKFLSR